MHLSKGEMRAHQDRQLSTTDSQRVEAHLADCPRCRLQAAALAHQAQRVSARLNALEGTAACPTPTAARRKLARRIQTDQEQLETQPMWKKLTSKVSRPAWAGIALIAVLAVALAFPSVRAAANSFLQLFRVEQVRLLPVDMQSLSSEMRSSQQLEALFTENVDVQEKGERQETATYEEAAALAGFPLRQLTGVEGPTRFEVQPGAAMTFKINVEMARSALREMGRDDIQLPDSLDGAVVKVDSQGGVMTLVGDCATRAERRADPDQPERIPEEDFICTTLMQAPSPTVSAPPEMDLAQMGALYLQVLGMNEEEAAVYAGSVDWATTLVMPVPNNSGNYEEVSVNGVKGVFVSYRYRYPQDYTLMWVENGIVYILNGSGDRDAALQLAASLK